MDNSESLRVREFYERLVGSIPCDPEDVRADLEAMSRSELVSCYVNWADRFVTPRPRRVVTWDGILRHGSAASHSEAVRALAAEIEAGNDLRPYLSDKLDRCGYVRKGRGKKRPRGVEWADKDYALNAYGIHHLHLNRAGTEELLYVSFSRTDAFLLMVGDHNSFDDGTLAQAVAEARVGTTSELKGILGPRHPRPMSEQNRLQRGGSATAFQVGDKTVLGAMLSSTGTSPAHTRHADRIIETIRELDRKIDEPRFGYGWFEKSGNTYPATPTFEWAMHYCDLCLIETTTSVGFPIVTWTR